MSQDKALTEKKLSALWNDSSIKEIDTRGKRIVMFSDMHLGDGGKADDFRHNHKAFGRALDYYLKENYMVILLGDIEEFWQFDHAKIVEEYDATVYKKFRGFKDGFFYRVHGNHDSEWGTPRDPARAIAGESEVASEALKLRDKDGIARILLVHGHQGDEESDKHSWSSRFFVRLYKIVEPVIKIDRLASATKCQIIKDYEKILYTWAKNSKAILICGHSHRAIFGSISFIERLEKDVIRLEKDIRDIGDNKELLEKKRKELKEVRAKIKDEKKKKRKITRVETEGETLPCYFNTGCALYPSGVTAIEIDNDEMRLVQWSRENDKKETPDLFVKGSLSEFIQKVFKR